MIHYKIQPTKSIGLIVSGRIELQALLNYVSITRKLRLESFPVYYFKLNEYDVFVIRSGYDSQQIIKATSLLIEKISPDLLISFGSGTAVGNEIQTGDVLYANSVTMLENNIFEQYRVISTLRQDIRRFVFDIIFGYKARMFIGTIVTVNNDEALKYGDRLKFTHPVYDLEMLAVAQTAGRYHATALALRGITDNIVDGKTANLNTLLNFTWNYDRIAAIKSLIRHPWWLLQFPKWLQNKYSAANHVASAVYSLLRILSIDYHTETDDMDYTI